MLARMAIFVSKRLQRPAAAIVCLLLAQLVLALATAPDLAAADSETRVAIAR